MDQIFEFLVPIAFFLFWILSQFLGNKKEADEDVPVDEATERKAPTTLEQEALERAKKIRAEIQRRIAERRTTEEEKPSPQRPGFPTRRGPQRVERQDGTIQRVPVPPARQKPEAAPEPVATNHQSEMEERLDRERERLRQAREERERAEVEAAARMKKVAGAVAPTLSSTSITLGAASQSELLRASLRDPKLTANGILLSEVLGAPVGLRSSSGFVPLVDQR